MQFDVRRFDVYRKIPKDLTEPTYTGAVISICSALFIVFLLLSEFYSFISTELCENCGWKYENGFYFESNKKRFPKNFESLINIGLNV